MMKIQENEARQDSGACTGRLDLNYISTFSDVSKRPGTIMIYRHCFTVFACPSCSANRSFTCASSKRRGSTMKRCKTSLSGILWAQASSQDLNKLLLHDSQRDPRRGMTETLKPAIEFCRPKGCATPKPPKANPGMHRAGEWRRGLCLYLHGSNLSRYMDNACRSFELIHFLLLEKTTRCCSSAPGPPGSRLAPGRDLERYAAQLKSSKEEAPVRETGGQIE